MENCMKEFQEKILIAVSNPRYDIKIDNVDIKFTSVITSIKDHTIIIETINFVISVKDTTEFPYVTYVIDGRTYFAEKEPIKVFFSGDMSTGEISIYESEVKKEFAITDKVKIESDYIRICTELVNKYLDKINKNYPRIVIRNEEAEGVVARLNKTDFSFLAQKL
jgi:hypothetical protein